MLSGNVQAVKISFLSKLIVDQKLNAILLFKIKKLFFHISDNYVYFIDFGFMKLFNLSFN